VSSDVAVDMMNHFTVHK